jgi:hypothetical protein
VQHRDPDVKVPAGFLRGVGAAPNTFAVERMIDELAKHAGIDPSPTVNRSSRTAG